MDYLLTSYRRANSVRVLVFDEVAADRTRTEFTVSIDIGLIGKYAIGLQELPLLCRQLLEKRANAAVTRTLVFAEADMALLADERAEALRQAQQKKFTRRFPKPNSPQSSV